MLSLFLTNASKYGQRTIINTQLIVLCYDELHIGREVQGSLIFIYFGAPTAMVISALNLLSRLSLELLVLSYIACTRSTLCPPR